MASIRQILNVIMADRAGDPAVQGHSRARYNRALLAGVTSAAARAVSVASVLISIPMTLGYLGVDKFSVWMTITSLTALLTFADFGLGNGLMNAVARCHANDNPLGVRTYISTAILVLCGVALIGLFIAIVVAPFVPWNTLLAVDALHLPAIELVQAMQAFIVCLAIGIPAAAIQKVQLALQLGYLANLWQLAANMLGLIALLAAVKLHGSLTWLVIASLATPSLVLFLSGVIFAAYQRPAYRPAFTLAKWACATELARAGSLFFIIQVAGAIAFASDTLIIAHVLNGQAVAQYSVAAKLMDGIVMLSTLFLTPLWPAYADAHARGESDWIKRTLTLSLTATALVTSIISISLVCLSRPLTLAWVGPTVAYSVTLFMACALWGSLKATGTAFAIFLNGLGWLGFQAFVSVIFAALATLTKIEFAQRFGIIGIPLALALSYILAIVIPYSARMPRILAGIHT